MLDSASGFDTALSEKERAALTADAAQEIPLAIQRARGQIRVSAKLRDGKTVLDRLYQSGSAKARVPRGEGFEVVLLNTAGGVTGGDRFETTAQTAAGTSTTLTTQTAERIYRSTGADGRIETTIEIADGARVDWLPQETILFDSGRLRRSLTVNMAEPATLLAVEPIVFGRTAMGETVRTGFISDQWRIRRNGKLVYADAFRMDGEIVMLRESDAVMGGALACASLLYSAPDAEDRIDAVRAALPEDCGASAWNGFLAARLVAANGAELRSAVNGVVSVLRPGPMPRVWFT